MNSLLLANFTKNLEEARKPASLHSRVTKDILPCNLNYAFDFCNLSLEREQLGASKVNNKDSFTRDHSQDFPPVIILSSIIDKVNKVKEKFVWVKGSKIVLNITE